MPTSASVSRILSAIFLLLFKKDDSYGSNSLTIWHPLSCDKSGEQMACAKIISIEFKCEMDLKIATEAWGEWYPKNLTPPLSRNSVQSGPKSPMFIRIFEKEEMTEQSTNGAKK